MICVFECFNKFGIKFIIKIFIIVFVIWNGIEGGRCVFIVLIVIFVFVGVRDRVYIV